MNQEVDYATYSSFETNATNIDKIKTLSFNLYFSDGNATSCFFIKHEKLAPLYLSCFIGFIGDYTIKDIIWATISNIHYKYKFIFETQTIDKTLHSSEPYAVYLLNTYPNTLNFTSINSLEIMLFSSNSTRINNIRLNMNGEDLLCQNINILKKCVATKEHFKNKDSGYYLIYHKNNANKYVTIYEDFGFNVLLPNKPSPEPGPEPTGSTTPEDYGKINQYSFCLLVLLCFLVL